MPIIDPSIPLSVFANTPSVGASLTRALQLKSLKQRQQLEQMQIEEEQRKMAEAQGARQAAAGAVTPQQTQQVQMPGATLASYAAPQSVSDGSNGPQQSFSLPTSPIQLPGSTDSITSPASFDNQKYISNLASNPKTAGMVPGAQAQFAQQQAQLDQHLQAIRSGQVKLQKDTADAMTAKVDAVGQLMFPIKQLEDSGAPPQQIAGTYQQARATMQQNGLDVSNIPEQYVPGIGGHLVNQGMAVKDAVAANEKAQNDTSSQTSKTVQTAEGVMQFNPKTNKYDNRIGSPTKALVTAPLPGGAELTDAAIVQAANLYLKTGQMPAVGMGKDAAATRKLIMNKAAELGANQDLADNKVGFGTYSDAAKKAQPQFIAIRTANQHLDLVGQAAKALDNGNVQVLNDIANKYGVAVGNDPKTTFDAIVTVAGPEVVKASAATGQMAESEIQRVRSNFQSGMSPKQIESNVAAMRGLMDGKYKSIQKTLGDLKGGNVTGGNGVGNTPATPAGGMTITLPSGKTVTIN